MPERIFGHIAGQPPESWFASRAALAEAGVHRPRQAGISGSQYEGADSVVLSGGYEDDEDHGDWILYTGQGGRDPATGVQVKHQQLNRGNLALAKSGLHGRPVRVVRGGGSTSAFAPADGYRYDGLFRVEQYWRERGRSGFYVWRFLLRKIAALRPRRVADPAGAYALPERVEQNTVRVVRDTAQARRLKERYDYRCQVCGERLEGSAGPYAEAAHIRTLGRPHNGPDVAANLLCLCPNHHVLFDYGAFSIADDHRLVGHEGTLIVAKGHDLDVRCLRYHREHYLREQSLGGGSGDA